MELQRPLEIDEETRAWAEEMAEKILRKERAVAERNRGRIPYVAKEHAFNDQNSKGGIGWWTNGFWGGLQWQLWNATKEELFRENALFVEEKLDAVFMDYNAMDHDAGFRWLLTAVVNARITGEKASKNRGLLAAANLAGRYNVKGKFIRAWNDWGDDRDTTGWAIIDCMMNLPLLYWASRELNDSRFSQIAENHAETAANCFVREDGSVRHIACFDPETGAYLGENGGQGLGEGSSWTRGQSWALYGFTLSFLHTGKQSFLETACKVADAFQKRIPEDGLIPVDFDQPKEIPWQDATAAAIAACGFLTLSRVAKKEKTKSYLDAALILQKALERDGLDLDPAHDELLTKGSVSYHGAEHEIPIIYGDYYFVEAIWKLTGKELFAW